MIPRKSQEKMLSNDISHICGGYVEIGKKQAQVWANLKANSWRLMVSILRGGVKFQTHHMIEKIWSGGMITNGLKSPSDLYLEAKNKKWADMEAIYVTFLFHIRYNVILVFWLILRDDNAVLISLIT